MASSVVITSKAGAVGGHLRLPSWGRAFWQDPNDGELFLAYASGDAEIDYVTSADSGVTWSSPAFLASCEDFSGHDNFDTHMDRSGHIHMVHRYNGSGCYKFIGKVPGGGWTADSGIGSIGYTAASTVGPSGVQASIHVTPGPLGSDIGGVTYPLARIVGKTSANSVKTWYTQYPHNMWTVEDAGLDALFPAAPMGAEGGFPTWCQTHASFPSSEAVGVVYSTSSGTMILATRGFGFWQYWSELKTGIIETTNANDTASGIIPLTKAMAFASGTINHNPLVGNNWPIVTTNASGIGMYCAGSEPQGGGSFLARMDSTYTGTNGTRKRSPQGWPFGSAASGMKGASNKGTLFGGVNGGANVDISWANEPGVMHFYFNDANEIGVQRISRVKGSVEAQTTNSAGVVNASSFTGWRFSSPSHIASGHITEALATREYTGHNTEETGDRFFAYWRGFKALRHPVNQSEGVFKQEITVTLGDSLKPSGTTYLVAHDWAKTVRATSPFVLPTFEFDVTTGIIPSGNNPLFVGVARKSIIGSIENVFDGDPDSGQTLANNDFIVMEFTKPILITRIEFLWDSFFSSMGPVHIEASLDDIDYRVVHETNGNLGFDLFNLLKLTSDISVTPLDEADQRTEIMSPFVAKFVKLQWTSSASGKSAREIRIYSPDTTVGDIRTGLEGGFTNVELTEFFPAPPALGLVYTEDFRSTTEGNLPVGWRTSGDWNWFVRASGEMSKFSKLQSVAPQDGTQHGGVFHGASNGFNDGFSIRTMESGYYDPGFVNPSPNNFATIGAPLGTSGILEVDVNVAPNELTSAGLPGRDISFNVRYDMLGSGVMNGPEDDEFLIEHSQDGLNVKLNDYWVQGNAFMNKEDWYKIYYTVPTGLSTLRWTYRRGTVNPPVGNVGERGIVWIDQVKGLNPPPTPAIWGFMAGENSYTTPTGIYGWLSKAVWQNVHGYMFGYQWYKVRHGYLLGGPNAESTTLGYLLGPNEGKINGYLLGGSGVVSFPTGVIDGYVAVRPGTESQMPAYLLAGNVDASGGINAWVAGAVASGMPTGTINGALIGTPSISGSINGFVSAGNASGSINAYVYGPEGVVTSINSYLKTQDNIASIYSYMNTLSSITGVIQGYLKTADGQSEIQGYLLVNEAGPQGYIKGSINGQFINGYMLNTGVSGAINAYLNSQMNESIQGVLTGVEFASGGIDGYMQVLASNEINGYIMGISGAPSGGINSFMIGVEAPFESINSYLISIEDDICGNHGTVALPSLPSYTLPSSIFFV